jgi:hypothetical protein
MLRDVIIVIHEGVEGEVGIKATADPAIGWTDRDTSAAERVGKAMLDFAACQFGIICKPPMGYLDPSDVLAQQGADRQPDAPVVRIPRPGRDRHP